MFLVALAINLIYLQDRGNDEVKVVEIKVALKNDTAPNGKVNKDRITSDPTILGRLVSRAKTHKLQARFEENEESKKPSFKDIISFVQPNGKFLLDRSELANIQGEPLKDGTYTLILEAKDWDGKTLSSAVYKFRLDTQRPVVTLYEPWDGGTIQQEILDSGFIEVAILDASISEPLKIKASDLIIRQNNKIIRAATVKQRSDGLLRIHYEGQLKDGKVEVTFKPGVFDKAGNASIRRNESFEVGSFEMMFNGPPLHGRKMQAEPRNNPTDKIYPKDSGASAYLHSGEPFLSRVDLDIPGRGFNWRFERVYRGGWRFYQTPLGRSWDFKDNRRLFRVNLIGGPLNPALCQTIFDIGDCSAGDILRVDGQGRADLYRSAPGTASPPPGVMKRYLSPTGFYTELSELDSGIFVERDRHGNVITYEQVNGCDPFRNPVPITSIEDRNGNTIHYEYNDSCQLKTVIDTLGREINFGYEDNFLTTVSDFNGRELHFGYNNSGNLNAVTGPSVDGTPQGNDFPEGKTERYTYHNDDMPTLLLHEVTAPNEVARGGKPREIYLYDDDGRVIEQSYGGTNHNGIPAGGRFTYSYLNTGGGFVTTACPKDSRSLPRIKIEPIESCEFEFHFPTTVVTDRNGNRTEYEFNPLGNGQIVSEFTNRDVRSSDPRRFITRQRFNGDGRRLIITRHEGNMTEIEFDGRNDDRLQQGNIRRVMRRPDPDRSGDQCEQSKPIRECRIVTTYTYEPIYNHRRTITEPRGNDGKFRPPILLPEEEFPNDQRYTTTYTFDYQENTNLSAVYRGLAARMEKTPDEVKKLLEDAGIPLGLDDVNGDGRIDQINGNVIRIEYPTANLLTGSNQAKTAGDTTQKIVELFRYNDFGQLIRQTDPEGNVTLNQYFSERDPDGDGNPNGVSGGDPATGGYLGRLIKDWLRHPERNSRTNPRPASIQTFYRYDPVGNIIRKIDGRGIATDYVVNQLNQVVQSIRAADKLILPPIPIPTSDQFIPPEGGPSASGALKEGFEYIERFWYDFNNNLVLQQKEDRGNTSLVNGNPPLDDGTIIESPDPFFDDLAFADTVYKYDILDKPIETTQEVSNGFLGFPAVGHFLTTRYRYDPNQNLTLRIFPEGNANSSIYDERDLLFRATRGAPGPESQLSLTLLGQNDPVNYDVRGGIQSRMSYLYNGNGNLVETVDAADTDSSADNNNPSLGRGDRTRHIYNGFDRRTSTVDSVGNQMVYQYDPAGNKIRELHFGPTGGPSPTSDGPDTLPAPVSLLKVDLDERNRIVNVENEIQSANLVNSNPLLSATEYLHDELSRTFQTDQVLFVNSARTPDVADGAADLGKADLTPEDNQAIPGVDITIAGRVSTRTEFDRKSRSTFTVEDDGDTSRVLYDGADRVIKTVDPEGNTVETAYDDNNNVVERREIDLAQGVTGEGGTLQTGQSTGNNGDRNLNDTNQSWRPFEWAGRTLQITAGNGEGQVRKIIDNTTNRLIVAENWEITPDDSSTYSILPISVLDHGQSSGRNTDETLNDETKTWTADEWKGRTVEITGGEGAGQVRLITGNNIIQLFVDPAWEQIPDDSSRFAIYSRPQPGIAEVFLTTNFYDLLDRLQTQIDNLGQTVGFRYDSRDNLVAKADAQGPAGGTINRRAAFSDGPLTVNTTNSPGNVMRYFYDGISRLKRQETVLTASGSGDGIHIGASVEGIKNDPNAPESSIPPADTNQGGGDGIIRIGTTYDDNSLISAQIDDQGNVTLKLYNNLNRRVTETKGLTTGTEPLTKALILGDREIISPATPNIFTPAIIPLEKINAQLAVAKARIDGIGGRFGRLFPALADQVDDSPPTTIVYGYDQDDILVFMEDENDTEVWTRYDAINRPIAARVYRAGQSDSHAGDPIFAPRQVNDPSNPSTDFPPVVGTTKQNYQFDGLSRLVRATDNNDPLDASDDSTVDFAYDSLSRVIEERQRIGTLSPSAISTGWRASNLRSSLIYPNGRAIAYRYDDLDRIDTIGEDGAADTMVDYNYIGASRVLERRYHPINGTRMTSLDDSGTLDIGYDGLRRQTELRNVRSDNTPIVGFAHTYDRMNNKLGEDKLHDAANNEAYEYDSQYRLTRFDRSDDEAIPPQHRTWNLDGTGNWKSVNGTTETREHSSFNEITARDVDGTPVGLAYDDNGNLDDDSTNTYEWDFSNRLRTVTRKADEQIIARYTYDAPGRRVQKQVSNSDSLNGTTAYYYDGLRVVEERNGADKVTQQYVYGNYIDEPLVLDRNRNLDTDDTATGPGDQRLFYHRNSLMNVYALTDTTGAIVEGYLYDAYGRSTVYQAGANGVVEFGGDDDLATAGRSDVGNPYLFTGRRFDSESGLFYYRTRYFDSGLGRFISRDPIGCWRDMTNLGNGYAYVGSNPLNGLDPFGLIEFPDCPEDDDDCWEQWCRNNPDDCEPIEVEGTAPRWDRGWHEPSGSGIGPIWDPTAGGPLPPVPQPDKSKKDDKTVASLPCQDLFKKLGKAKQRSEDCWSRATRSQISASTAGAIASITCSMAIYQFLKKPSGLNGGGTVARDKLRAGLSAKCLLAVGGTAAALALFDSILDDCGVHDKQARSAAQEFNECAAANKEILNRARQRNLPQS